MIAFIYWLGFFVALVLLAMVTGGHIERDAAPYRLGNFLSDVISIVFLSLFSWLTVISLLRDPQRKI